MKELHSKCIPNEFVSSALIYAMIKQYLKKNEFFNKNNKFQIMNKK